MLTRLVCQDLLAAGAALGAIGVDGDGIIWLAECGSLPRQAVTDLVARGPAAGLPVLAATSSPQAAAELAKLTNVVVAHRMTDAATAGQLATAVGVLPAPEPAADAAALTALREDEFLLAVKHPQRLVWPAQLVRARVPSVTRDRRPAAAPRPALAGARDGEGP
jgi:hypothetical protein